MGGHKLPIKTTLCAEFAGAQLSHFYLKPEYY